MHKLKYHQHGRNFGSRRRESWKTISGGGVKCRITWYERKGNGSFGVRRNVPCK
jgi:hypothetical protein